MSQMNQQQHVARRQHSRAVKTLRLAAVCWVACLGGQVISQAAGDKTMAQVFRYVDIGAGGVVGGSAASAMNGRRRFEAPDSPEVGGA